MSANRDIDGKLKQKFGDTEPHVGDWKPKKPRLVIGCLLPVLILASIILSILWML